jgi:hypothetical protein
VGSGGLLESGVSGESGEVGFGAVLIDELEEGLLGGGDVFLGCGWEGQDCQG